MDNTALIALAKTIAGKHGLDPVLVCAVCDHETGGTWDPFTTRYEEAFYEKYVRPMKMPPDSIRSVATEAITRATSYGLMQIMGEAARELGFTDRYIPALCDPNNGIEFGCRKLAHCMALAKGNVSAALEHYNGGADAVYAAEVLKVLPKYR
jgi:Transglycosylase SLT domain